MTAPGLLRVGQWNELVGVARRQAETAALPVTVAPGLFGSLDPFLRLALSADPSVAGAPRGEKALYLLRDIAEQEVKRELEGLPGVAAVRVQGGLEREVRIEVREDWLAARQLTLEQVRQSLASENVNIAGGSIIEGDVEYPDGLPFGLLDKDLKAGKGLSCVGHPVSDMLIELEYPDEDLEPWS